MDIPTLQTIQANFLQELKNAQSGKQTSLAFITHQLPQNPIVKNNEVFQVLVIGGSVCKNAKVIKEKNSISILEMTQKPQPPFITKEDLFSFIEKELLENVSVLALNFAYPLQPVFHNNKLDGVLVSGAKENTFTGLIGKQLGLEIGQHMQQQRNRSITVSVANDTICLLLSGLMKHPWETLAAGIVGTGYNAAFFLDEKKLVNLEAGNFNKFSPSEEEKEVDLHSSAPGLKLFEKEISGAYLYRHFNSILQKKGIDYHPLSSTWELKTLALKNIAPVSELAMQLIEKSASLVACQIGGITLFKQKNMAFVMDGSFFWEEDIYKNLVEQYLQKLIPNFTVTFHEIENTTIIGAAKLVT